METIFATAIASLRRPGLRYGGPSGDTDRAAISDIDFLDLPWACLFADQWGCLIWGQWWHTFNARMVCMY